MVSGMVVTVLVGLGVWLVAGFLVGAFFGKVVCVTGDPEIREREHGAPTDPQNVRTPINSVL